MACPHACTAKCAGGGCAEQCGKKCSSACKACTNTCTGSCEGSCKTCSSGCNSNCKACSNGCATGCIGTCSSGCRGCRGCGSGCASGCDGTCKSGCLQSCSGGCNNSCTGAEIIRIKTELETLSEILLEPGRIILYDDMNNLISIIKHELSRRSRTWSSEATIAVGVKANSDIALALYTNLSQIVEGLEKAERGDILKKEFIKLYIDKSIELYNTGVW